MTTALIDVPRCLNVDAWYVGPPRSVDASNGAHSSAWNKAAHWGGTQAYREQAIKECLDTIAVLRSYREPLEGETWLTPAASERRLLAQVNAIVALGPQALQKVVDLSIDPDVPDPGRIFAGLLVLACVEGRDWLKPALKIFVMAQRSPTETAAAIEALSLGPNPEFAAALEKFLADERPRVRAGALRVLAFRGALSEAAWASAIGDPDPSVLSAALSAPLRGYDRAVCQRLLQPLFVRRESESLVRLALRAGLSLRLRAAHDCAAEIAHSDPSWADAAYTMAMFGVLADVPEVRQALGRSQPDDGIRAAGVLGSIDVVPDLLELLDRSDLEPETGVVVRQALARITGLAFDSTEDRSDAQHLWSEHASRFDRRVRYRHGRPVRLDVLLQSLQIGAGARHVRQDVYMEMLTATESRVPRFSPFDFVGVQDEALRRIERWLADPVQG